MEKKILRILLKHYTKISYKGGIAKVIFDDEFENIAEEIAKSALAPVSQQRELLIAFDSMREFDIKHDNIEESVDYFLKNKESYL